RRALFLRSLLRGAGDVPRRRHALGAVVSTHPRRTDHPPGHQRSVEQRPRRVVRHRDGADHPASSQPSAADLSTMNTTHHPLRMTASTMLVAALGSSLWAVTPATLVGPDLQPRAIHITSVRDGRIGYFDANRELR